MKSKLSAALAAGACVLAASPANAISFTIDPGITSSVPGAVLFDDFDLVQNTAIGIITGGILNKLLRSSISPRSMTIQTQSRCTPRCPTLSPRERPRRRDSVPLLMPIVHFQYSTTAALRRGRETKATGRLLLKAVISKMLEGQTPAQQHGRRSAVDHRAFHTDTSDRP